MDLNHSYSQHQIALIRAGMAINPADRNRYLDSAAGIAKQIGSYQQARGAEAGSAWLTCRQPAALLEGALL